MKARTWILAGPVTLVLTTVALAQQYPIMDRVADRIIQKYQNSSCQQLAEERAQGQGRPKPPEEQRVIELLRQDPNMRAAFINRVAGPIANKMFECGMIP